MFRCPTCVTVLPDPSARRCPVCGQNLRRRRPTLLGDESRISTFLVPLEEGPPEVGGREIDLTREEAADTAPPPARRLRRR